MRRWELDAQFKALTRGRPGKSSVVQCAKNAIEANMNYKLGGCLLSAVFDELVLLIVSSTYAQTTINGNSLAYRSTGSSSSSAWTLDRNGYVGTYITLAAPGSVT